jgi:D-tyrosyl-tRNA(Tyr) deacylase
MDEQPTLWDVRAVLQRVLRASVTVAGKVVGAIDGPGLVVLLGATHDDGPEQVRWMAAKIRDVRLLRPPGGSGMEASLGDLGAPALVVSQFTLYGDARKGRRPTWQAAAPRPVAEPLYEGVCAELERLGTPVSRGRFGADMVVDLVNDGPVTLVLETPGTCAGPDR